jgi:Carboxypeptidase regulatory-like domain/Bacterial Ig domain
VAAALVAIATAPLATAQPMGQEGGLVRGSVHATLLRDRLTQERVDSASGRLIFLADFEVKLLDDAGTTVASGRTNVFGRYSLRAPRNGTYQLCWDAAGWLPDCAPDQIVVRDSIAYPPSAAARPDIRRLPDGTIQGAVWGVVGDAGGTAPYFADEFFGLRVNARIAVTDLGGRPLGTATPNNAGEYVLVGLGAGIARTTASLEGTRQTRLIPPAAALGDQVDFLLPNSRVLLGAMVARAAGGGGQGLREAAAGDTIDVSIDASDVDGDPITFQWRTSPNGGTVTPAANGHATWQLGKEPGQQTLYVVAHDGNGGYTTSAISLAVGATTDAVFSGQVTGPTGLPIGGATVAANTGVTRTDADGGFTVSVKRSDRYVVNVSAPGFLSASKIYDRSLASQTYRLANASVQTVNPRGVIRVQDNRRDLEQRKLRGASVTIPADTLVGPDGRRATGSLQAQIATIDIANGEMPGDFGARGRNGGETNIISFGAVEIELRDSTGRPYNLARGQAAEVSIPVPASMPQPPPSIALWTYNRTTGFWDEEVGTATLNAATRTYVGKVSHFSTINTDLAKTDAACVRVLLDNINRSQLRARVAWESGGTQFTQQPEFLLGDALNAIYRLPPNTNVRIRIFDAVSNLEVASAQLLDATQTVLPNNVVNTGAPSLPLWPPTPFENCVTTSARLPLPVGSISLIPFLSFEGVGTLDQAVGYYRGLDPGLVFSPNAADTNGGTFSGGTRSTLGAWWAQAGFNASGGGGRRAAYLNHGDLGFGRDMHMRRAANGDVFAYVTNYGGPNQNGANADLANTANTADAIATVAMQATTIPGVTGRTVQFYVYYGGQATGPLLNSADLDGFGPKFVPNLCQTCHGGASYEPINPTAPTTLDLSLRASAGATIGSSFREFDFTALRFPPGGAVNPNSAVLPDFRALNTLVVASNPQPAITDLINGWYGVSPPSSPPNLPFTPPGWISAAEPQQQALYQQVVSRVCRTCHVAFNQISPASGINWTTFAQFRTHRSTIQSYVCGANKLMPHTLMAYRNFWLSAGPHMPDVLGSFTATGWVSFAGCP